MLRKLLVIPALYLIFMFLQTGLNFMYAIAGIILLAVAFPGKSENKTIVDKPMEIVNTRSIESEGHRYKPNKNKESHGPSCLCPRCNKKKHDSIYNADGSPKYFKKPPMPSVYKPPGRG